LLNNGTFPPSRASQKEMSSPPDQGDVHRDEGKENDEGSPKEDYEWSAFYDDEGRIYYYNNVNGESAWDAPEKFNPPPPPEEEGGEAAEGKEDGVGVDGASQSIEVDTGAEQEQQTDSAGPWVAFKDGEGREYFFNTVTEATTWDKPPDFQPSPADEVEVEPEPSSPSRLASPIPDEQPESPEYNIEEEEEEKPEEEPEETIDPSLKRVQEAEKALNQPDAIMEPGESRIPPQTSLCGLFCQAHLKPLISNFTDVMVHVTELVRSEGGNPQKAIQALSESYYGQTAVCGLLSSWLAGLKSQAATSDVVEQSKLFTKSADDIRQMAQDVVNRIAKERFTKTGGDSILHLSRLPAFLEDMIDSNRWRKLLIDLSASNKDSALLNYCLQKISKRGHHREIARRINQSDHFAVFNAMLASELTVVGKIAVSTCRDSDTSIGLDELVSDLRRTCTSTAYTYIYAIEVS
jgi:hypothetical protein